MKKTTFKTFVILAVIVLVSAYPTSQRIRHYHRHGRKEPTNEDWRLSWKWGSRIIRHSSERSQNQGNDDRRHNIHVNTDNWNKQADHISSNQTTGNRPASPGAGRFRGTNLDGLKYLQQFGYMQPTSSPARDIESLHGRRGGQQTSSPARALDESLDGRRGRLRTPENSMSEAIKKFQRVAHIKQTGILDEATLTMMAKPRCGVPDNKIAESNTRTKRYTTYSSKWEKTRLTYNISGFTRDLDQATVEKDITDALNFWTSVTPITITKADQEKPDIDILFAHTNHGDGKPFDDQGGVLAHAFEPSGAVEFDIAGDIHFDEGEDWTHGEYRGANLMYSAVHQFGHALGLDHSDQFMSVMFPFGRKYNPNLKLYQDDIDGIQSLYGANPEPPKPSTTPTPTPELSTTEPSTASPETCVNTVDAITVTVLGETVAFRDSQVYLLSVSDYGVQEGYPKSLSAMFPDGPEAVDAALTFPHYLSRRGQKYTWLFKGDKTWKYKNDGGALVLVTGYPKYISEDWGILGKMDSRSSEGIYSAYVCTRGNVHLTKGNKYWKYGRRGKVLRGYPRSTNRIKFLRRAGITEVDAAFRWINNTIYFFKDGQYYGHQRRRNMIGPKDTGKYWFGCSEPPIQTFALQRSNAEE
ncbi:unnamed protein product [Owenia fusiformis]|uniref:Uncharacterized protein n=1 Tax=Owenia fusiformis TaxID=6347 RepID=A0A8J1UG78_OWEFU|nr:unnamed protein product [Owenia fusiformis]